ncbi:uncharacterized protein H6S33_012947 [Morchella sextelata]|uniref:uncharacterized protein n=1 Tax=Morchella sextelata TaxID=1174677 RepID=UPI001D051335|nr:uncharacterized protein H6S33_012947 [Morchella sextelata]KAH0609461.1 hypothetical protein H6S33_012947 [Morchella sextelata]
MFRLLSRQAFKAVPRPGLRLSASRHVHSMQVPYSGPPSYDTIFRRFSSNVDPQAYFTRKRQQEAKERGEFIDIHDIGRDPSDYDVLITDIKHETLETTIAEELGIPYLSKATDAQAEEVVEVVPTSKLLGIGDAAGVMIGGHPHFVLQSPLDSHFSDINLLGTDFCSGQNVFKVEDYPKRRVKLYFGGEWEVTANPKL